MALGIRDGVIRLTDAQMAVLSGEQAGVGSIAREARGAAIAQLTPRERPGSLLRDPA